MKQLFIGLLSLYTISMVITYEALAGDAQAAKAKVPLCVGCHGAQGEGKAAVQGLPAYPALAGQIEDYLVKSILAYKNDERKDPVMGAIAKSLSDEDIANLAAYYSALGK